MTLDPLRQFLSTYRTALKNGTLDTMHPHFSDPLVIFWKDGYDRTLNGAETLAVLEAIMEEARANGYVDMVYQVGPTKSLPSGKYSAAVTLHYAAICGEIVATADVVYYYTRQDNGDARIEMLECHGSPFESFAETRDKGLPITPSNDPNAPSSGPAPIK